MANNTDNISTKFIVSGTLGDMFIVFCKLYGLRQKGFDKGIKLIYYTTHPEFYPLLQKLLGYLENIAIEQIVITSLGQDTVDKVRSTVKKERIPYINTAYNGADNGIGFTDPDYIKFDPYPQFDMQTKKLNSGNFKIGIQLHSGKVGGNFKGFSLKWLGQFSDWLPRDSFSMYLFGTGEGYCLQKVRRFCKKNNIADLVGRTEFADWLGYIKAMDFLVTPEGFPAFFAMSQKVRSLVFYTDYQILGRVHPNWRRENIILSTGQAGIWERMLNRISRSLIKRNHLLAPIKPEQVWSVIYGEKAYR